LRPYIARKDRWDIYNNLPKHGIRQIAKETGYSWTTVWRVLHGYQCNQRLFKTKNVLKCAEGIAAIHIWKTRFCKFKSEL